MATIWFEHTFGYLHERVIYDVEGNIRYFPQNKCYMSIHLKIRFRSIFSFVVIPSIVNFSLIYKHEIRVS